ncbi:MAG: D-alanine--D-alanine ligase [Patescibacteria group bacterium]
MHKIRVGVLRGGPSSEYDVSLKTGAAVLENLSPDIYHARDILIDKQGVWHVGGIQVEPHTALEHVDVVFNALHGQYGEDGKVQHILEFNGVPFTGSNSFASAIGMNKELSKNVYKKAGLKTPQSRLVERGHDLENERREIFKLFPLPLVVKPTAAGSSIGVAIVKDFTSFSEALEEAFKHGDTVLVEEYIQGKEATCGVIDHFRDQVHYALPPIEVRPPKGNFFDYKAKYGEDHAEKIVPGNFTEAEKKELEKLAILAHQALGLRHYSRSDFIVHPRRGIFILETNTLPGLTQDSLVPTALASVGSSLSHFLHHLVELAISRK